MRSLLAAVGLLSFSYGCASDSAEDDTTSAEHVDAPKTTFAAPLSDTAPSAEETGTAPTSTATGTVDGEEANAPADSDDEDAPPAAPPPPPALPAATPTNPGPAPTNACTVSKDSFGFFTRNSGKSDYVAFVPASYSSPSPMRLIVGLHGCSDDALNFAKWGINPWDSRATQQHIGISVGGESGSNKCWKMGADDEKVMAAIEDIAKCFWVDRSKIVVGGYSSGGQLAYRVGLKNADKFAGVLIENSGLYAAGDTPSNLVNNAGWNIPVAHAAHTGDGVFPIAKVRADWTTLKSGGHPVATRELPGGHDGDGKDWSTFLIPQSAPWTRLP